MHAGTRSRTHALRRRTFLAGLLTSLALGALMARPAAAALPPDLGTEKTTLTLPTPPSKHWVWINDWVFPYPTNGTVRLVDGDNGRYLGTLSTGYLFSHVLLPRDGKVIYAPETYFSRGTRGVRTDMVTIFDGATLKVVGEVVTPPKRVSDLPQLANAALTDDDRFLLIYNFNPGQSVTVVDTASRTVAGEIETPGCGLIYPTGPRSFFDICADGGLLAIELDDAGKATRQRRIEPLFDVAHDPVTEKAVRVRDTWYFVSFDGQIYPVRDTARGPELGERWWLTSKAERAQGWRPGGVQQLAAHAGLGRLYAIMHQGGRDTHKDPGKNIWVYDLATHRRVQRIATRRISVSITLSTDDHPLLYSLSGDDEMVKHAVLDVYEPGSGRLLRSIPDVGLTPTLLVTP